MKINDICLSDLIRRGEAIEMIQSMQVSLGGREIFHPEAKKSVLNLLDELPTVDAEPVRHGAWTPKKVDAITTEFECSECGRTVTLTNDYFGKAPDYASSYYPYCHCGAKMDGKRNAEST